MNEAAVGFQCPDCVRQGERATRSGQLRFGGRASGDPRLTSWVLIGVNAVVWVAILLTGGNRSRLGDVLALLPRGRCVQGDQYWSGVNGPGECAIHASAHWMDGVATGAVWQPLTVMFTHVEPLHVLFNMVALYFLGPGLEGILGRSRFLALYVVSGLCGSAAIMLASGPESSTVGASGAIFGLMGGLVVVLLKMHGDLQQVLVWLGINLAFTFTAGGMISWQGHVGGLVGGLLVGALMAYAPRRGRPIVQWAGTGVVLLVALGVIAVRAIALG